MPTQLREATTADLAALRDLERAANLAALGHVFPPDRFPFPDDAVLARWSLVLDEPGVTTLVSQDDDGSLVLFAAYDDETLRHLAVHPDHWGQGLASAAIATALHAWTSAAASGVPVVPGGEPSGPAALRAPRLARPGPDRREAPWPPHPIEMRYSRLIVASER